jgi:hypothetical protein
MRYHGKKGSVKIGATKVASLSKWTLNAATDTADVTAFGDPNKQYVQGLPDLKGSLGGWFDDQEDALFAAADATAPVTLELMPVETLAGTGGSIKWTGPAYLSASIDCPANGPVSVSGDFVAAGAWTRTWTKPTITLAEGAAAARA